MRRIIATTIAAAALVAIPATTAHAKGPGGGGGGGKPSGGSGTVEVRNVDPADPLINYGDTVTFDVWTTATDKPAVQLDCYQGGTLVYTSSAGFYPEWPWSKNFTLRSGAWAGGAADCNARLYKTSSNGLRTYTLGTQSFHVEA
jgi:hypothetical protein